MQEKLCKTLCKYIAWFNEEGTEEYYHYYIGFLRAMECLGMKVEIFRNEFVLCDGKMYRVEDYKDA